MTQANTIIQISTYDRDNLDRLSAGTGHSTSETFHIAMAFCDKAVDYMREGYKVSARYETSYASHTSNTFSPHHVAQLINNRRSDVEQQDTVLPLYRATADRLENIKDFLKVQSDTLAVAFALEFAREAFEITHTANNGKKATIFFSTDNRPGGKGYLLSTKHPYNANFGNSFRRAARRSKQAMGKLNPFARKAAPAPAALPAPQAPAATPEPAAQTPAPMQEIQLLHPISFKKRGGKNDGFDL